ncbi:MAG: hypothetical protein LH473_07315 [Chitinophagales bacterium]|nr:hypothetical protein [Chitinophagales bacterium]
MHHTSGITIVKDSYGRKKKLIVDLTKVSEEIQDLIDGIISDLRRNEPADPAEKVFKLLDKKFRLNK